MHVLEYLGMYRFTWGYVEGYGPAYLYIYIHTRIDLHGDAQGCLEEGLRGFKSTRSTDVEPSSL